MTEQREMVLSSRRPTAEPAPAIDMAAIWNGSAALAGEEIAALAGARGWAWIAPHPIKAPGIGGLVREHAPGLHQAVSVHLGITAAELDALLDRADAIARENAPR